MLPPWILERSTRREMVIPESAGDQYHGIVKVLAFVAEYIRRDAESFQAANRVFHEHPDVRFSLIPFLDRLRKFPGSWFPLRHGYAVIGILCLVSLEAQVHMLFDVSGNELGRSQRFEHGKVVRLSLHRPAQKANAFLCSADDEILPRVALFLARVVVFLPIMVLWPLDRAFGPVNEHFPGFGKGFQEIVSLLELPSRQDELFAKGRFEDAAQRELPATGVRPVASIEEGQNIVRRVTFVVEEDEEQFINGEWQKAFATAAEFPLPLRIVPVRGLSCTIQDGCKYRQKPHKLIGGEAS